MGRYTQRVEGSDFVCSPRVAHSRGRPAHPDPPSHRNPERLPHESLQSSGAESPRTLGARKTP
eukprot:11209255-Alexandrium_andersonii.AAC.1